MKGSPDRDEQVALVAAAGVTVVGCDCSSQRFQSHCEVLYDQTGIKYPLFHKEWFNRLKIKVGHVRKSAGIMIAL